MFGYAETQIRPLKDDVYGPQKAQDSKACLMNYKNHNKRDKTEKRLIPEPYVRITSG
jgi:hypothetical protein